MDAKLKAKELVGKYMKYASHFPNGEYDVQKENAKKCALIAVNEILLDKMVLGGDYKFEEFKSAKFWEQVKKEISTL